MDNLIRERGQIRSQVTRLCNKCETSADNIGGDQLLLYATDLRELCTKLRKYNADIHLHKDFPEGELDDYLDNEEVYDERTGLLLIKLERLLNSTATSNDTVNGLQNHVNDSGRAHAKLKLPQITFPTFSNNPNENLGNFLRAFEAIIQKHNLFDHEKYAYLKNQLSGGPLALINSIDINADNQYVIARKLLEDAFGNADRAKQDVLKRLSELKQIPKVDPYVFIGELKAITTNFGSLKIEIKDVLQYFLWNSLDVNFQVHLTAITNKSFPSLEEIEQNLFEACSRYVKNNCLVNKTEKVNHQVSNTAMAINIKPKELKASFCVLCRYDKKSSDHSMQQCQIYSTAKLKVDKLKNIGGCIRCSFSNHKSFECKFQFSSPCKHCKKDHMSYLCLKNSDFDNRRDFSTRGERNNPMSNPTSAATSISNIGVEASFSTAETPVILPTFTAEINGPSGFSQVRVFKDGGCQRTFIDKSLANKLDLEVIRDNVSITIEGFNNSKTITTQIVSVPITIGEIQSKIEAIVTDNIRTKFEVKNIHTVVNHFVHKGYQIADKWLLNDFTDIISGIGIVLGTNDDQLIPMCTKLFGDNVVQSSYIDTDIGVVFSGDITRMINNLPFLPTKIDVVSSNVNSISNVKFVDYNSTERSHDTNVPDSCEAIQFQFDQNSIVQELKQLDHKLAKTLNVANDVDFHKDESQTNIKLVDYILQNSSRDTEGRLVMPLSWNERNSHLLSRNFNLSKQILNSSYKKLNKDQTKLDMYDAVFGEQLQLGIIEKIHNVEEFILLHPECSFLAHMAVYRMTNESTKCRVVFLSNLCERKGGKGLSHNQVILPGPCLNQKMSTAIMLLRFDKYLLTFDLQKAFLMIGLRETDVNRLLFLWYNNIKNNDFSVVAYKSLRLPFGLPCSPTILMLGLYKILILDQSEDQYINELKKAIYNAIYMDNGSYTTNSVDDLHKAFKALPVIFGQYKFKLQQFFTNEPTLQSIIDSDKEVPSADVVKLFGLQWNRVTDTISPSKINLNENANSKRGILSSLNEVYDVFNVYSPLLLRAKLFMQKLQIKSDLTWDETIPDDMQREWQNIVRQANAAPQIGVNRSVGNRNSNYSLICFTDASGDAYGCVIYIKDEVTNEVNFLLAKNKVLSLEMKKKTMPSLELQGIEFGVETMFDVFDGLAGETVVMPINITSLNIFTDSTACLGWLESHSVKYDKVQKLSVFVRNRLSKIEDFCLRNPVSFRHVSGETNPADCVSRPMSYRVLQKNNFYNGPDFLKTSINELCIDTVVNIPNFSPRYGEGEKTPLEVQAQVVTAPLNPPERLIAVDRYSSFSFMVRICKTVMIFVDKLRRKVFLRKNMISASSKSDTNYHVKAVNFVLKTEQNFFYPEVFEYFRNKSTSKKDIPAIMLKYNLYVDKNEVIRVKSKIPSGYNIPILLPKESLLTTSIIRDIHEKLTHSGMFPVLKELHKNFYVCNYFSVVKKVLRNCVTCKRLNEPPIKINQNSYRDFRVNPGKKPFSYVFVDYAGPFLVSLKGEKVKVWLLLVTCLYTRAINIKICQSLNLEDFMRALQMHIFEYGIFEHCTSDMGSQILAGANLIRTFLDDPGTKEYFESNGMQVTKFNHFSKGNSSLGSLIEVCVKQAKQLIQKSIRTLVLDYFSFEFIICKTVDLLNKRPVAFKESLRSLPHDQVPFCITPEMLIKGYETCTLNVIPQIQTCNFDDPDYSPISSPSISENFKQICKVKSKLIELYHSEFMAVLITQAIDKSDRYRPVLHKQLKVGDVVLLVEPHLKRYTYPMARVHKVETNSLGEVTSAYVYKGSTKELVYRHVTSLILLISSDGFIEDTDSSTDSDVPRLSLTPVVAVRRQPERAAANRCRRALKHQA